MDMQKISVLEQAAKDYAKLIHPDKVAEIDSMSSDIESYLPRTISAETLEKWSQLPMDVNPLSLMVDVGAVLDNNGTVSEEFRNLNSDDVVKEVTKRFVEDFNNYFSNKVTKYFSNISFAKMNIEPDGVTIKASLVNSNTGEIIDHLETLDEAAANRGSRFMNAALNDVISWENDISDDRGVSVVKLSPKQIIKDMVGWDNSFYEITQAQKTFVDIFNLFKEKEQSFNEFANTMELFRIADIKPNTTNIASKKYKTSDLDVRAICTILGSQLSQTIPLSKNGVPIVKDSDEFFTLVLNVDSKNYALKWIEANKKLEGLPIKEEIEQRTNLAHKEMENKKGSFFGSLLRRESKEHSNDLSM